MVYMKKHIYDGMQHTTRQVGSSGNSSSECLCARGYFYDRFATPGVSTCRTCPDHAVCDGGLALPYPTLGYAAYVGA